MIKKILKIKNFKIFNNFNWANDLPQFKKQNIIYGFNGSGKSTLSNLFRYFETNDVNLITSNLEYNIELENNIKINEKSPEKIKNIKVFNKDFIEKNIDFNNTKTKSITLILGEKNKELEKQIIKDEEQLKTKEDNKNKLDKEKNDLETTKNKSFTEIAKTIAAVETGSARRNYDARDAKNKFETLQNKNKLSDEELLSNKKILQSEIRNNILEVNSDFKERLDKVIINTKEIIERQINITEIERLKNNQDINIWVEEGFKLHKRHNVNTCEYCLQQISKDRNEELNKYYTDEEQKLKNDIETNITSIEEIKNKIIEYKLPDKSNFYSDKQETFNSYVSIYTINKDDILIVIENILKSLNEKKNKQSEKLELNININENYDNSIFEINNLIKDHNNRNNNISTVTDEAREKIEIHYLSTIYDEIKEKIKNISEKDKNIKTLEEEIKTLEDNIAKNKNTISSTHKSCELLNDNIAQFLGRDEIKMEVSENNDGFIIKRNNMEAKDLSEGEKTAIAFIFYLMSLKDNGFNVVEGIIVIDDPISSLDSNSLFQAFAFMKEYIKDSKQIIILTHNHQFLRLVLNWFKHNNSSSSSYMINNYIENNNRYAKIDKIDKLLEKHETEYNYLFSILYKFNKESDTNKNNLEKVYNLPNIARKFLETYLMFTIPNNDDIYNKLQKVNFNGVKKSVISKFSNDQSHKTGEGFNPSLVQETKNIVSYLLEMVESKSKEHFDYLVESINN